jgi:hypothetical protein
VIEQIEQIEASQSIGLGTTNRGLKEQCDWTSRTRRSLREILQCYSRNIGEWDKFKRGSPYFDDFDSFHPAGMLLEEISRLFDDMRSLVEDLTRLMEICDGFKKSVSLETFCHLHQSV